MHSKRAPNAKVQYNYKGQLRDADFNSWQEGKVTEEPKPTYAIVTSRSNHPGVVNVALVDGSVQSVTDGVDLNVWRAMATRNGAEVVELPF
jgi:prepilin-type processing-associated H-X9-DG protein